MLSETTPLAADARALLDGAAIVGDPFEIDFAAEVAGLERGAALVALDVLVAADLVQVTDDVRRFRFRHPIVRRTVYETVGPGRRLAGHARAAAGLERAGAGPVALAHHVEQSAAPGDAAAVALLAEAAAAGRRARAADRRALALGRAHARARRRRRRALLGPLAGALAGAGRFDDARRVLLELLAPLPEDAPARTELIVGLRDDGPAARRPRRRPRCACARRARPTPASRDAVALNLELAAHASLRGDPLEMRACATEALAGARREPGADGRRDRRAGDGRVHARRVRRGARARARGDARWSPRSPTSSSARGWRCCCSSAGRSSSSASSRSRWSTSRAAPRSPAAPGSAVLALELMVGEALGLLARGRIAEALDVADGAVEDARPLGSAQSLRVGAVRAGHGAGGGRRPGGGGAGRRGGGRADRRAGAVLDRRRAAARRWRRRSSPPARAGGRRASCSSCRAARTSRASSPASAPGATRCSSARRCSTGDAAAAAALGRARRGRRGRCRSPSRTRRRARALVR